MNGIDAYGRVLLCLFCPVQWLSYWVVFAVYTSVEALSWPVLRWIPMYGIMKIGVTVWMVIPQYQGATFVYRTYIRPALYTIVEKAKQVPQLEPYVRDFNSSGTRAMRDVAKKAEDVVKMTEPKPQPTLPEDPFAPLKTHSQ